jgi:hypothetical protein
MKQTIALLLAICWLSSCQSQGQKKPIILEVPTSEKVNGVTFVGHPSPINGSNISPIVDIGANYVTFVPFSYGSFGTSDLIYKNLKWQWWGERVEGVTECVQLAQQQGLKVMIKPQIWFDYGEFTGNFELTSDKDWKRFEEKYTGYILEYARLSEQFELEMFCIGTELCKFVEQRNDYWLGLIEEVREVYSGKLTYAGNWDSYKDAKFWQALDYVGVDAYFPICSDETPGVKKLTEGWQPYIKELSSFAENTNKPILFTEWGYRSADYCAKEPWDYSEKRPFNGNAQQNAYKAVFDALWNEQWFAGGFLWKWHANHTEAGGGNNNRFTPQNKPAQAVLREYFSKYSN